MILQVGAARRFEFLGQLAAIQRFDAIHAAIIESP